MPDSQMLFDNSIKRVMQLNQSNKKVRSYLIRHPDQDLSNLSESEADEEIGEEAQTNFKQEASSFKQNLNRTQYFNQKPLGKN
mmetsp:Transcript_18928/g.32335  ORF Transcript_18928/g.32335 Transcript_18928/m.32335 type:complete len:83 (+) Transcript_18928:560-808(+)